MKWNKSGKENKKNICNKRKKMNETVYIYECLSVLNEWLDFNRLMYLYMK